MVTIEVYWVPIVIISSISVKAPKNLLVKKIPKSANKIQLKAPSSRPWLAAQSASAWRFSPSLLATRELIPTPVPTPTAIIRVWIGNASDTAVSALSLIWATK